MAEDGEGGDGEDGEAKVGEVLMMLRGGCGDDTWDFRTLLSPRCVTEQLMDFSNTTKST